MTSRCALLVLSLVILFGTPLQAQRPRPERPYRGLFGGGVGDAAQIVTVNASLGGGYSTDIVAEALGGELEPRSWRLDNGRGFTQFSGGINYSLNRDAVQGGVSIASAGRYFPTGSRRFVASHSGGAGISVPLWGTMRLSAGQTVAYQPYNALSLFPQLFDAQLGDSAALEQDLDTGGEAYRAYASNIGLSQQVSRRGSLSFGGFARISDFPTRRTYITQGAQGNFRLNVARGLDLNLGYGYREGREVGVPSRVRNHDIDVGIDFNRGWSGSLTLSPSRRTTLSFSTGSSVTLDESFRPRFRLTGNARLNHEIGRTWNASIAYGRNITFNEFLRQPVFSDAVTAGVGGLITRRLQFQSSAGASLGAVGVTGRSDDFVSYRGTVGLTAGMTRYVGLGVNYSYYRSSLDNRVTLLSDIPRNIARQSVVAYVALWAPLVQRAGRQNATR